MTLPRSQLGAKEFLSVAIEVANDTLLRKLDQSHSLVQIIEELCLEKKLKYEDGQYALQLQDLTDSHNSKYINEYNRGEVKNGSILKLVFSPSAMAKKIIEKISTAGTSQSSKEDITWALNILRELSSDASFLEEYLRQEGLHVIFSLILDNRLPLGQLLNCLKIIDIILERNSVTLLTDMVIKRIVEFVVSDRAPGSEAIATSLSILARLVAKSDNEYVAKTVGLTELEQHIWSRDPLIQKKVMLLLNAMSRSKNNRNKHVAMVTRNMKELIGNNILKSETPPDAEMEKELYNFQLTILAFKEKKFDTCIDPNEKDKKSVQELTSVMEDLIEDRTRSSIGSLLDDHVHMPLLKFDHRANSMQDILLPGKNGSGYTRSHSAVDCTAYDGQHRIPGKSQPRPITLNILPETGELISRLTLDCMLYFARSYPKPYNRMLLAEEACWQPFSATCQRLVRLVVDVVGIKRNKKTNTKKYQPLLFYEPAFIEELFCRIFLQLGRTRRDMKARTRTDQEKVMWVLQRQLLESLNKQPSTLVELTKQLRNFNYATISELLLQEWKDKENRKLNFSKPILELKASKEEATIALIRDQRINVLHAGTLFPKTSLRNQKLKKRSTYVSLTKNKKSLNYHDCDENGKTIEDSSGKVNLGEVLSITFGKKCPHIIRDGKTNNKAEYEFAFSLILDHEQNLSFDFIAPDQTTFDYWTDGINVLLGKPMQSESVKADLDKLVDIEVRLQLLDIMIGDIPNEPPPVPKEPPNYHFVN